MQIKIVRAEMSELERFFSYLERQLAENGVGKTPLFQPVSQGEPAVSDELRYKFINGFNASQDELHWRWLWLAKDQAGEIRGHIDLRHHAHKNTVHRVLLGMGVHKDCRQQGVGAKLVNAVIEFCHLNDAIDWIDLGVLADNVPAKNLYLKCGFSVIGKIDDQFRVDGKSVAEILMTKCVKRD